MPMPPARANDLEYSSTMNERHMPVAPLPPMGPSPLTSVNISLNIELRNTASKSCAAARALPCGVVARAKSAAGPAAPGPSVEVSAGALKMLEADEEAASDAITSPRYRPGWRQRP